MSQVTIKGFLGASGDNKRVNTKSQVTIKENQERGKNTQNDCAVVF